MLTDQKNIKIFSIVADPSFFLRVYLNNMFKSRLYWVGIIKLYIYNIPCGDPRIQ